MPIMSELAFPPALVQLQKDFLDAEQRWQDAAGADPVDEDAVRRAYEETQELALRLHRDPWMRETEHPYQARMALRAAASRLPASR